MLGGIIGEGRAVVFELDQTIAPLDVMSVGNVRTHAQIFVEHFTIWSSFGMIDFVAKVCSF
jgi:hypothetical protein